MQVYSIVPVRDVCDKVSACWVPFIVGHVLLFHLVEWNNVILLHVDKLARAAGSGLLGGWGGEDTVLAGWRPADLETCAVLELFDEDYFASSVSNSWFDAVKWSGCSNRIKMYQSKFNYSGAIRIASFINNIWLSR